MKYSVRAQKSIQTGNVVYYPVLAQCKTVGMESLINEIETLCTLSEPDLRAVIEAFKKHIVDSTVNGRSVQVPMLGIFAPSFGRVVTQKDRTKVSAKDVKYVRCRFRPSVRMKAALKADMLKFEKVRA